ncbi:MAG: outer membrane lipoprotein-sorting protein [Verrucomicrobiota bacterium]
MTNKPLSLLLAACALATPLHAQDAAAILEGARVSASLTKLEKGLTGNVRKGNSKTPLVLFLMGSNIQFQFQENNGPWQVFHMRMGDNSTELYEVKDGKPAKFPSSKLTRPIGGTDLTYEDLALRFLYWPGAVLEGSESVGGQDCWKIRVDKPNRTEGAYQVAYVWVHKKYGAFMRIRAHNKAGGLIKEFQVEDVMQIQDVWTLRKMQVATCDPATGRRTSITEVTFDTPNQKSGPRGSR